MNEKVFRSRVSVLLVVFVLAVFAVPMTVGGRVPATAGWVVGGTLVFIGLIFTGIRYVIAGETLFFKLWGIPLGSVAVRDIRSVSRSHNPLSSPAVSLKRLRLSLWTKGDSFALVSPVREREFIEALKAVNPEIRDEVMNKRGWWRIWDWDI